MKPLSTLISLILRFSISLFRSSHRLFNKIKFTLSNLFCLSEINPILLQGLPPCISNDRIHLKYLRGNCLARCLFRQYLLSIKVAIFHWFLKLSSGQRPQIIYSSFFREFSFWFKTLSQHSGCFPSILINFKLAKQTKPA